MNAPAPLQEPNDLKTAMPQFALTRLLNHLLGPFVAWLMQAFGIHVAQPQAPINDTFAWSCWSPAD